MRAEIALMINRSVIGSCASPVKVKMRAVMIRVIALNLVMVFGSPVVRLSGYGVLRIVDGGGEGKGVGVNT